MPLSRLRLEATREATAEAVEAMEAVEAVEEAIKALRKRYVDPNQNLMAVSI
jgi:hypothetical protein